MYPMSCELLHAPQGLTSEAPRLVLPDGSTLQGSWTESVGSLLFVQAPEAPCPPYQEPAAGNVLGLTESILQFTK